MRRLFILGPLAMLTVVGVLAAAAGIAQAAPPAGDRWALVIGIDHFEGATRPNTGAVGDAQDVQSALVRAGFPSDHIRVLTDDAATNGAIHDGLKWLASHSSDTSFSVFSYSGHVKQDGTTEYLWPHDNQFISDTDLANNLKQVKGYLWANISGCEAAGFDEGISGPKRIVTAASQENEKGYELPANMRNSVFTYYLVDAGILQKQADANRDGKVSIQEAFKYAAARAPALTVNESNGPQHPYMAGGDGTDWFLEQPTAPAAAAASTAKTCLLFLCF
jgi:uncharacterized caspase-like protein